MIRNNSVSTRLEYPTLEAAVAEATFMAGMEKNSDLVFAAACGYLIRVAPIQILTMDTIQTPQFYNISTRPNGHQT